MTIELTDSNFPNIVTQTNLPIVIDFWAEWCPPCKEMASSMDDMANKYNGKAIIAKVDVDNNPIVSTTYGIRNIPAVLFIVNGKVIDKQVGYATVDKLENKLDKLLQS